MYEDESEYYHGSGSDSFKKLSGQRKQDPFNTCYLYKYSAVIALSAFQYGYSMTVINQAINVLIGVHILDKSASACTILILLGVNIGAIFGSLIGGEIIRQGRKIIFIYLNYGVIIACIMQVLYFGEDNNNALKWVIVVGKFIHGLATGIYSVITPIYLKEIAPREISGKLIVFFQLFITSGQLFSFLIGLIFTYSMSDHFTTTTTDKNSQIQITWRSHLSWRLMFGFPIIVALVQLYCLLSHFKSETPHYYLENNQRDECIEVLYKIYSRPDRANNEMISLLDAQERIVTFRDLFTPLFKKALTIGICLSIAQQLSGINIVMYFSAPILSDVFDSNTISNLFTFFIGLCNMLITIISLLCVDKKGRKRLLIIGCSIMAVSLLILGIFWLAINKDSAIFEGINSATLITFISGFALSLGPIGWLYISEILPAKGMALGSCANWFSSVIILLVFLLLAPETALQGIVSSEDRHTAGGILVFCAGIMLLCPFLIKKYLPETAKLSEQQIKYLFVPDGYHSMNQSVGADTDIVLPYLDF